MVETDAGLPQRLVWSVGALLRAVGEALAARFVVVTVAGELSGFTRAASGHCYFTLKDPSGAAVLRGAMFRRAASLLEAPPAEGQRVEVRGRIGVYEPRGELQLIAESLRPTGAGTLYEQFLRLKARLDAEGLFDPARKRPLPTHPRCVGVVTSTAAAALRDVATTLVRRAPHVRVVVYPAPVQGAAAPAAVSAAIELAARHGEAQVLIVCRGGGSLEDLWAFNDEQVVRAIAASPIPVVCGVGHETDVTLADFAADLRAATPTAAAALAVPERDELVAGLARLASSARRCVERSLDSAAQRLDRMRLRLHRPRALALREERRVQGHVLRLSRAAHAALATQRDALLRVGGGLLHAGELARQRHAHRLHDLATRLAACDPGTVVARGYALVETPAGSLVTDPAQLLPGASLRLTLARGRAEIELARVRPE